jgi:hypothetical protein
MDEGLDWMGGDENKDGKDDPDDSDDIEEDHTSLCHIVSDHLDSP